MRVTGAWNGSLDLPAGRRYQDRMTDAAPIPLIGVPADIRMIENAPFHAVGDKYLRAILEATGGLPLAIPAHGELYDVPDLVHRLDGLLLTGSPSNVHPGHYGAAPGPEAEPHDRARDATTLPVIREALDQAVPLLAICRGCQELNVALGGTLHPRVHALPGKEDHRAPEVDDWDVKYAKRHPVALTEGGAFQDLAKGAREIQVNSLHWQAVDRLAGNLAVEAVAPDGTVEGLRVTDARAFALAVQWHPEYEVLKDAFSTALFGAFGKAAVARAEDRARGAIAAPAPRTSGGGRERVRRLAWRCVW